MKELKHNENMVMLSKDAMMDLYEKRLIVLIENDREDGGNFSQILFDKEQFKIVSKAVMGCFPREKDTDDPTIDIYDVVIDDKKIVPDKFLEGMRSCG